MPLKPADFDPNWSEEMKRFNADPHAFGSPKIKIATTADQRNLLNKEKSDGTRTGRN